MRLIKTSVDNPKALFNEKHLITDVMNKFIKILMALPLIGLLTACSGEDELTNSIDFTSPYAQIVDDPDNLVQHERYELFQEFGVPVYFNDTIATRVTGKDLQGNDVYTTETIDLNWGFQSHDKNSVNYKFDYLTTEDQQLGALDFARTYLSMTTEKMRPFCLLLVDTLYITRGGATTKPEYHTNFRALVVSQLQDLDNAGKQERATNILRDMVLSKVTLNEELVARFGAVSSRDKLYGRPWVVSGSNGGLGCVWGVPHTGSWWHPEELYDPEMGDEYVENGWSSGVYSLAAFEAERALIFAQIGKFGFICGDTSYNNLSSHLMSPANISQDLNYYVTQMLQLGETEFMARYGGSTMVKKKYQILADYITGELGINLDF